MEKRNLFNYIFGNILPENTQVVYNPNKNTILSSRLEDNNGNVNLFKIINDNNAPFLTQRIMTNAN